MTPTALHWFELLLDPGPRVLLYEDLLNPRDARGYDALVHAAQRNTAHSESVLVVDGKIEDIPVVCAVFDFNFLGGTMGIAAGERLYQALHLATQRAGMILIAASAGIRIQEGNFALLQMPRMVATREKLRKKKVPLITIAAGPTFGGVAASLVATSDVVFAISEATFGLTGPRAAAAVGDVAPVDTAVQALRAGLIDDVFPPEEMREPVRRTLQVLSGNLSR